MSLSKRSSELEIIDLGPSNYNFDEYKDCLHKLKRVGELLGGDRVTLKILSELPPPRTIVDIGCGGGQLTIELAKQFPNAEVIGYDISPEAIQFAKQQLSESKLKNVTFEVLSASELPQSEKGIDILTASLLCHHMTDEQLIEFLKKSFKIAKYVVINDLHRHWLAYIGFALISWPLFRNSLIYHDGLLSIKRAFTRKEWMDYFRAAGIPLENCSIKWYWAFRWGICIDTTPKLKL